MRLYLLDAWRESTLYTDRERAALGWTEALTRLSETQARPMPTTSGCKAQFSQERAGAADPRRSARSTCGTGCRSACAPRTRWTRRVPPPDERLADFEAQRPRLLRLAYRMLGSIAEAEDVVQDAWLRWRGAEEGVDTPGRLSHPHRDAAVPRPDEVRSRPARDLCRRLAARADGRDRSSATSPRPTT